MALQRTNRSGPERCQMTTIRIFLGAGDQDMDTVQIAVLALTSPLTLVELGIVGWYFLYWDQFPKYSIRRLLPWASFLISLIGIPLLQIAIYKDTTSKNAVDDPFIPILIFTESVASIALTLYLLWRRRSQIR